MSLLIHAAPLVPGRVTEKNRNSGNNVGEHELRMPLRAPHTQCCDGGYLIFPGGLRCIANIDIRRDGGDVIEVRLCCEVFSFYRLEVVVCVAARQWGLSLGFSSSESLLLWLASAWRKPIVRFLAVHSDCIATA